jgi:hypothetical protein
MTRIDEFSGSESRRRMKPRWDVIGRSHEPYPLSADPL